MNHRLLIQKLYNITQDSALCRVIQNLLSNKRFYVELNNERSRWRLQKNGLPQGSVFSPILFNIYTNDQPIHDGTRSFIYADDLCITAQYPTFTEVEDTIEEALSELTQYYRNNSLRANPDKTQVTAFYLRNREVKRSLNIAWNGVDLENTAYPKYLGVTLDRTLNYKQHILNTKMKVATRNNLLKKLANSEWGTNARTIRTTALALCYSTAEYAAPVWARSSHANKLNPVLNQSCRSITGCLKPTNVEDLYLIAGIAPLDIRREVCARVERTKQTKDKRHSLFGHTPHPSTGASEVKTTLSAKCTTNGLLRKDCMVCELESKTAREVTHQCRPTNRRLGQGSQQPLAHLEKPQSTDNWIHLQ